MHRNLILFVSCLLLLVLSSTASAWEIDGDRVWQNDSNCYISVTPHTLHSSGWAEITVKTHSYSGNIDACLGFNTTVARPSKPAWKNHWENTTTQHQAYFYNVTSIEPYDGSDFDYGNDYNTYQRTITYYRPIDWEEETNTTIYELAIANVSFDSYEEVGDGDDYMIHWHTDHSEWVEWTRVPSSRYHSVTYDFMGFDKWYYATDLTVQAGYEYTLRFWVDVPVSLERSSGKYFFAVKPSTETIGEAVANGHFYYIDPWWDTQWNARREIKINNTGGSELSHYQVFVNLTDTPINATSLRVVNETAGTTVPHWNELVDANGNVVKLWFNCTHIPANSWVNGTYYIYYGNDGASSTSDGEATFEFFDDFPGSSLDGSKWTTQTGRISVSNSIVTICDNDVTDTRIAGADQYPPKVFRARMRMDNNNDGAGWTMQNSDGSTFFITRARPINCPSNLWNAVQDNGNRYGEPCGGNLDIQWHVYEITWKDGNNCEFFQDGSSYFSVSNQSQVPDTVPISIRSWRKTEFDWILTRKFNDPEPMVAVGGAEYGSNYPSPPNNFQSSSGLFWDTGKTWINYTWEADPNSVMSDSYNVSLNGIWYNGSSQTYRNVTIDFPEWANISVYSYNATYGTLSNQSADGKEHALISLATIYRKVDEGVNVSGGNTTMSAMTGLVIGNTLIYGILFIISVLFLGYSFVDNKNRLYGNVVAAFSSAIMFFTLSVWSITGNVLYGEESAVMAKSLSFLCVMLGVVAVLYTIGMILEIIAMKAEEEEKALLDGRII